MFKILALLAWMLLFLAFPSYVSAASISITSSPPSIAQLEEFGLTFTATGLDSNKQYYAKARIGVDGSYTKGQTKSGDQWLSDSGELWPSYPSFTSDGEGIINGTLTAKAKNDSTLGTNSLRVRLNKAETKSNVTPDGETTITLTAAPTPTPTPVPTQTPTPNPTSTPTPKPTNTPTPTQKPASSSVTSTSTPTPKPKPKNTPTSAAPISQSDEEVVLGIQKDDTLTTQEELDTTPSAKTASWKTPAIAAALIIPGLGLVGFSLYSYFQKAKGGNIENGDSEDI